MEWKHTDSLLKKVPGAAVDTKNLTVFRDMKESITIDFLEKGATISSASYCQLLGQNSLYWMTLIFLKNVTIKYVLLKYLTFFFFFFLLLPSSRTAKDRFSSAEKRALDRAHENIYQEIRTAAEAHRQVRQDLLVWLLWWHLSSSQFVNLRWL